MCVSNVDRVDELLAMVSTGDLTMAEAAARLGVGVGALVARLRHVQRALVVVEVFDDEEEDEVVQSQSVVVSDPPEFDAWPLLKMRENQCRWPTHDVGRRDHLFCGRPTVFRHWCERHSKLVYAPTPARSSVVPRPR